MQDPEQSDTITVELIGELRGRARRMRWMAHGFIAAIIVVISGAIAFYFYAPQLATRESAARLTALQERLTQQDELIRQGERDRAALKADIIQRIQQQEDPRIFDPVQRAEYLTAVQFIDQAVGWAVGVAPS